jgi:hypothetical protein
MNTKNIEQNKPTPEEETEEIKEYKKETKEIMAKFCIGGKDTIGNTIERIFSKGDEFVIYDVAGVSPVESIKVFFRPKEKKDLTLEKNYNAVKEEFNKFKSVLYKTNADLSYKIRAAHAVSVALSGDRDFKKANELLHDISREAQADYRDMQKGRLLYLAGALAISALMIMAGGIAYLFRFSEFALSNKGMLIFLYSAAFSAFGGLFSIAYKIKEIVIEKGLDKLKFMYFMFGAQRLLFSIFGGFAVIVLVKSKILFADLAADGTNLYGLMAICYLAGFSETFIPNALKSFEEKSAKK